MTWYPRSHQYEFESHGRDPITQITGNIDHIQRKIPGSKSKFYKPPKADKSEFYRAELQFFDNFESRRHAVFAGNFRELTKPYHDCDAPFVQEMANLTGEKCL
jgi:hypothetical protein